MATKRAIQVHGHRGCTGPHPENTVPAFLSATATGCQWLELDVVITGDEHVLVSHEAWMDHHICRDPQGQAFTEEEGRAINIFKLPLAEVQCFGCVPDRAKTAVPKTAVDWHKPTLVEVVRAVDHFARSAGTVAPGFNIEVKSIPALYGTFQPAPNVFAELVISDVRALRLAERCIIQSFDIAILEDVHALAPHIPLALLVDNTEGVAENLGRLSFAPTYYSVSLSIANARMAADLRNRGIGLLVWTVNTEAEMERMLQLGVDGIITDHPSTAMKLIADAQ